jgi:hypothetical protein
VEVATLAKKHVHKAVATIAAYDGVSMAAIFVVAVLTALN